MPKVYCSAVLPAPVEQVWPLVRDFDGMPAWHPGVTASRIEDDRPADVVGCIRAISLADGVPLRERLLGLDDLDHALVYAIVESPLPMVNHLSELRLRPVSVDDTTYAQWVGRFDSPADDEAAMHDAVSGLYTQGLAALVEHVAG